MFSFLRGRPHSLMTVVLAFLPCRETHDGGDRLQVLANVSNTCVNTCFWLRHHKPEGAFKNLI